MFLRIAPTRCIGTDDKAEMMAVIGTSTFQLLTRIRTQTSKKNKTKREMEMNFTSMGFKTVFYL